MPTTLHSVLTSRRNEIIGAWTSVVKNAAGEVALSFVELVDHLPQFLDELTESLRLQVEVASSPELSASAAKHGVQRFRLGFDLDAIVREYGVLHRCILDVAHREGAVVSVEE